MAPSPRMRLRSARLPDLDNPHPHPPNAEAGPSSPRKPKGGAGGTELRRVPSKSKLAVVGSRPRKPSGRARREGTAGEESGNESEGSRRGVLRSAGGGGRSRGRGGGRVRFKGGRGWERMDVLLAILCTSSLLLLALFAFHLTRPSPSHLPIHPPAHYAPPPPPANAPPPPAPAPNPPSTPTQPQPQTMEDKVRLIAHELGVSPEDFVRSLQKLGGEVDEDEDDGDGEGGWRDEL